MKKFLQKAATNWEKTLFWSIVIVLIGLGANWLFGLLGGGEGSVQGAKHRERIASLINMETAFAFRQQLPPQHMDQHPFFFVLKVPEKRKPTRPWKQSTKATKPKRTGKNWGILNPFGKKPKVTKSGASAKPTAKPAVKPAAKKSLVKAKPKVMRIIQYQGCMTTGSGKRLALVRELKTNKLRYLLPGDKLGEFAVKDFDDKKLNVTDPGGKNIQVPFGQQKKVLLP